MRPLIDWPVLLRERHIQFIERGPNVKRGAINIRCPFCGSADPSYHMGLDLETGWFACWRNKAHRGKSPVRLLMVLLRVSFSEARAIAGLDDDYLDPEGFDSLKARLQGLGGPHSDTKSRSNIWPSDFQLIAPTGASRLHWQYLLGRGFPQQSLRLLVNDYGLSYTRMGHQSWRIIFPYFVQAKVVTWTGRAIAPSSARYLDQPTDAAITPVKKTLYNHDALLDGGKVLIIVEGPVDVLKVDAFGREVGVRAVGMSTASISDEQAHLLAWARPAFDRCILMSDQKVSGLGITDSMKLKQALGFIPDLESQSPPFGLKDTGELNHVDAVIWTDKLAQET